MHAIDIKEDYLLGLGNGILEKLLLDRTTGENIIWATDDYASMGDAYTFFQHVTPELITGEEKGIETLKDNPELYDKEKNEDYYQEHGHKIVRKNAAIKQSKKK